MGNKVKLTLLLFWGCAIAALAWRALPPDKAPAEQQKALSVTVAKPELKVWPVTLPASGWFAPWEESVISSEIGGLKIEKIFVEVGSVVTKGQEIATLTQASVAAELHKQQAAVDMARAKFDQARANADRSRSLAGTGAQSGKETADDISNERIAAASLASEQASLECQRIKLSQTKILAPDNGVISSKTTTLGAVVSSGTELARLIRQQRVEWHAEVPAQRVLDVHAGQSVAIQLPAGRTLKGTVRCVAPAVTGETGRSTVFVEVPASDRPPQAKLFATGAIELGKTRAFTVPETAVTLRDGMSYLFILRPGKRVARFKVETGRRQDGRVEILTALDREILVVQAGGAFLADQMPVNVVAHARVPQ
jgi:RND family efflux transporter MFP subunit